MAPAHFRLLNCKQGHLTRGTDSESGTPAAKAAAEKQRSACSGSLFLVSLDSSGKSCYMLSMFPLASLDKTMGHFSFDLLNFDEWRVEEGISWGLSEVAFVMRPGTIGHTYQVRISFLRGQKEASSSGSTFQG